MSAAKVALSSARPLPEPDHSEGTAPEGLAPLAEVDDFLPPSVKGFRAELAGLDPRAPHTLKDVAAYVEENLGAEAVEAIAHADTPFVISVGDGPGAVEQLERLGYRVEGRVEKAVGFHQLLRVRDGDGSLAYAVVRVNGEDRVVHLQSLLELAGLSADRLTTVGAHKSWKPEYLAAFRRLGPPPDAVLYGFSNTCVSTVLRANLLGNALHLVKLAQAYRQKHQLPRLDEPDLASLPMQVLELANGKTAWVFNNVYGDLCRDLMEALVEHGAKDITFLGTAGALGEGHRVGDVLTPASASEGPLSRLAAIPGIPRRGHYERVRTPNVETQAWLASRMAAGVDVIEVELGHFLEVLEDNPQVKARVGLVISDVLGGPDARDMTEWTGQDVRAVVPLVRKVLDSALGAKGDADYRVRRYRTLSIL